MNAKLLLPLIAATFFSLPAYAQDCSGGADGGMDATGNQCNAATVAADVASEGAALASARSPKVETNKAASCSKCALKRTAATRHTSERQRVRHG